MLQKGKFGEIEYNKDGLVFCLIVLWSILLVNNCKAI